MLLGLVLGTVLVAVSILFTRLLSTRLRLGDPARVELVSWAAYLVFAALAYVAFALRSGGRAWMPTEVVGLAVYSAFVVAGMRGHPRALALGWALHAAWDIVVHARAPEALVPEWYRWACLVYDLAAAGYLLRLPTPAPRSVETSR